MTDNLLNGCLSLPLILSLCYPGNICTNIYFQIDFIVRTRPVAGFPSTVRLLYMLFGYTSRV